MRPKEQTSRFRELLDANHARWSGIARAYAEPAEREDLLQEIALQVWRGLPSFRGDSAAGTWAYRVALNTAMAWRRKRGAQQNTTAAADVAQLAGGREADRTQRVLDEFLASLGPTDRAVMLLHLEATPQSEAAEVLGVSEGAFRVRLHRIRKRFEAAYCDSDETSGDAPNSTRSSDNAHTPGGPS